MYYCEIVPLKYVKRDGKTKVDVCKWLVRRYLGIEKNIEGYSHVLV